MRTQHHLPQRVLDLVLKTEGQRRYGQGRCRRRAHGVDVAEGVVRGDLAERTSPLINAPVVGVRFT